VRALNALLFPLADITAHRAELCDYCFFGGSGGLRARLEQQGDLAGDSAHQDGFCTLTAPPGATRDVTFSSSNYGRRS
jgi:hypothetical protein